MENEERKVIKVKELRFHNLKALENPNSQFQYLNNTVGRLSEFLKTLPPEREVHRIVDNNHLFSVVTFEEVEREEFDEEVKSRLKREASEKLAIEKRVAMNNVEVKYINNVTGEQINTTLIDPDEKWRKLITKEQIEEYERSRITGKNN